MAELRINMPKGGHRVVSLQAEELLIGRDASCDVVLEDPTCSRRHFRVYSPAPGKHVLEDLGSHNGTYVNRDRVHSRILSHGDDIRAGHCSLLFLNANSDSSRTVVLSDLEDRSTVVHSFRHRPETSAVRLRQLLDLTGRLVGTFEPREVLERAMDICMETLGFERGLIVEATPPPGQWALSVVRNLFPQSGQDEPAISRSILTRAIRTGERSIISLAMAGDSCTTDSMVQNRICSAMCVPITWRDDVLGALYGDRLSGSREYSEEDVDFLAGLAGQIGAALRNSHLLLEAEMRRQLEHELALAREIQEGLFPQLLPLQSSLGIAAFNSPGRSVSGDYYDVIQLDDHRTAVLIADVSGKGVSAAMLMANLQAAVRVVLPGTDDLVDVVRRLNRLIYQNTGGVGFITALLMVVDTSERVLHYVDAGHYPPYLVRSDGRVDSLKPEGDLPLGVEPDADFAVNTEPMGDEACTYFLYTDGIPEALNADDEFFGLGRIEDLLRRYARAEPSELVSRVRRALSDFVEHSPQTDDITMVALHVGRADQQSESSGDASTCTSPGPPG